MLNKETVSTLVVSLFAKVFMCRNTSQISVGNVLYL